MRTRTIPLGAALALGLTALPLGLDRAGAADVVAIAAQPGAAAGIEADAETGDPFAQFVVGRRDLIRAAGRHDPALARAGLAYLIRSANAGFAPAARFAGSVYLTGDIVPRDTKRALAWFHRAAALGDADSERVLGEMYFEGQWVPKDVALAVRHWEAYVANPGALHEPEELYATAYRLGVLHAQGAGTRTDPERARALWARAAGEGQYPPAMEALAAVRAKGDPTGAVAEYLAAARAYLRGGLKYDIDADTAREHVRRILAEIERLSPGDPAIGLLTAELATAEAMRQKSPRAPRTWAAS
jgi:TPR repeat protein